jgi:transposase
MLPLSAAVKIYYCRTPINLHKSFDGLPGAVRRYLETDPAGGHLFVFFNRTFKMVKILYWDSDGYVIWSKRLEQGRFNIPKSADGKITLDARELHAILSGIKPKRYYKRFSL